MLCRNFFCLYLNFSAFRQPILCLRFLWTAYIWTLSYLIKTYILFRKRYALFNGWALYDTIPNTSMSLVLTTNKALGMTMSATSTNSGEHKNRNADNHTPSRTCVLPAD